jgi:DNA-directed RNA polymerase subunit RPC12/RpoP
MSGCSDSGPCPRCGAEMSTYSDYKPFDYLSGECANCGFYYFTEYRVLNKKRLKALREERKDSGYSIAKSKIPSEKALKEFDKEYGIKRDI